MIPAEYVPIDARGFRLTLGLRALEPARWIEVDEDFADDLDHKRRVLGAHHDKAVAVMPEGLRGSAELLDTLTAHLLRHHPGIRTDVHPDHHPIEAAGLLVQEDLCLMTEVAGRWILSAASVCAPSRWNLSDKIGQDLHGIHDPVPGYEERLGIATDRFFDRLAVDRPMWRLNWTLMDDPQLFQPGAAEAAGSVPAADLTFRVERQTLRRLPATGDVVFTIRTYRDRLGDLVGRRPVLSGELAETLATVPPETLRYKGWTTLYDRVMEWLQRA